MRIPRGVSAVLILAALAFIASLALPAAGQPASTTSTTIPGRSGTTNPFVTSTTLAPGPTQSTAPSRGSGADAAPGRGAVLILVRRLTWLQASAAVRGRSETIAAGLVSTLPRDASLAERVLSLAAGRHVDAAALAGGTDPAAIARMRAANPDAHFGGLPQVRVVAASGLEAAALIGLGPAGDPPPVAPLEVTGPVPPAAGELLVVAVPDAAALQRILDQLHPASTSPSIGGLVPPTSAGGFPPSTAGNGLPPSTTAGGFPSSSLAGGFSPSSSVSGLSPSSSVGGVSPTTSARGVPTTSGVLPPGSVPPREGGTPPGATAPSTPSRFVIVGLESPSGRANTAPFVALGGSPGLVTSDSTRRSGLVAFQDVRPTLAGSAAGTDGSTIRVLEVTDPLGSVRRLDRQVASLVSTRTLAIPVAVVIGILAIISSLLALLLARGSAARRGREVSRRVARALMLMSLAVPSGYLVASTVAPLEWPLWLGIALGSSVLLALAAWLLARLSGFPLPRPRRRASSRPAGEGASAGKAASAAPAKDPAGRAGRASAVSAAKAPAASASAASAASTKAAGEDTAVLPVVPRGERDPAEGAATAAEGSWAAPALLGALLTGLIVVDLLLGGLALSRPLLGNSAFDGERFYGLGNGYFAYALAGVFLVVAFRRLSPTTTAALLVGLALADGLPILGADVGGAITATLTAAVAWLLLRRRRWTRLRILLVMVGALVVAAAIAVGVGLATGPASHGSRIARDVLGDDPSAALRAVKHQLSGNFGLLSKSFWAWWGPLLVGAALVCSLRPPRALAGVPVHVRRAVGVGAIGSVLLIVLNDTGVTAAAGSGLLLMITLFWCALEPAPAPAGGGPAEKPKPAEEPVPVPVPAAAATSGADDVRKPPTERAKAEEPTPAWQKPLPDWGNLARRRGPLGRDAPTKDAAEGASPQVPGGDGPTGKNGDQDAGARRDGGARREGPAR
jgi:hypothetical protein